jgi:hypothetical protein
MAPSTTPGQAQPLSQSRGSHRGPIAWIPNHELDVHQWAVAGRRFGTVGRCIQWLLGDWLTYGNARFGERYARASQITGYDPQTLMNMVYVASRFPISRRREHLSWSHHETLAALEEVEQERWLEAALEHRWSVSDLRTMLRASRKESALPTTGESRAPAGGRREVDSDMLDAVAEEAHRLRIPGTVLKCPRCGERIVLSGGAG